MGFWVMEGLEIAFRSAHNCGLLLDLGVLAALCRLLKVHFLTGIYLERIYCRVYESSTSQSHRPSDPAGDRESP